MSPIPLLVYGYLHSLPASNTPLTPPIPLTPLMAPNSLLTLPTPPRSLQCPLMQPIPFWPLSTYTLSQPPIHPLVPPNGPNTPNTPRRPQCPLCHLYPFWPLSTYTPCQPPNTPLTPLTPLMSPNASLMAPAPLHPIGAPNAPLCYLYPFLLSIVITVHLTIFMQLKCSFSIIAIFNCCHFATDHLHVYVQFTRYHP